MMSGYWSIHESHAGGFRANATGATLFPGMKTYNMTFEGRLEHRNFRIFLPPGTMRASVKFYASATDRVGVIARAGRHPTGDYGTLTFDSDLWARDDGADLAKLTSGDYLVRKYGDHGSIMYQTPMLPLNLGMWLYCMLYEAEGGAVQKVSASIVVDTEVFFDWFDSVKNVGRAWDYAGNPKDFSVTKPPPAEKPPISIPGGGGQNPVPEQPTETGGLSPSKKAEIDYFFEKLRAFEIWKRELR